MIDPTLQAVAYGNAINSGTWLGGDPETWKVIEIAGDLQHENTQAFWRVRRSFQYRSVGWRAKVLNKGHFYLSGGKLLRVVDNGANVVNGEVRLDAVGNILLPHVPAVYINYRQHRTKDFNDFHLP